MKDFSDIHDVMQRDPCAALCLATLRLQQESSAASRHELGTMIASLRAQLTVEEAAEVDRYTRLRGRRELADSRLSLALDALTLATRRETRACIAFFVSCLALVPLYALAFAAGISINASELWRHTTADLLYADLALIPVLLVVWAASAVVARRAGSELSVAAAELDSSANLADEDQIFLRHFEERHPLCAP